MDYDVLSERGVEQVTALIAGPRRRHIVADRVISGSLRRQRDTAKTCASELGIDLEVDDRWDEYDVREILTHHAGASVGLEHQSGDEPVSSREFQPLLDRALLKWVQAGASSPSRESWPRFQERVTEALGDVVRDLGKGQATLVVSSGGVIAAITGALLGLPPEALIAFNHASLNTGITKLAVGRAGITLVSSNEHAHLDEADAALITYR